MTRTPFARLLALWRTLAALLRSFVGRAPPAAPGRFARGMKWSAHGALSLSAAPPWRDYLLYLPRGYAGTMRIPLFVWIHGCRQDPAAFAAGTRIARFADERSFMVLLPGQSRFANAEHCWNWFDPRTARGFGEAAIVVAQVMHVMEKFAVDPRRVYVAGLSSGGTLAATLACRSPGLFAAAAFHSAVPFGAASDPHEAHRAMAEGARRDTDEPAAEARAAARREIRLPALIIHGAADAAVAPANANHLARQFLLLNGISPAELPPRGELPPANRTAVHRRSGSYVVADYHAQDRLAVRLVTVPGLGHAWSGGDPAYPYFADSDPDATRLICDFFAG